MWVGGDETRRVKADRAGGGAPAKSRKEDGGSWGFKQGHDILCCVFKAIRPLNGIFQKEMKTTFLGGGQGVEGDVD